MDGKHTVVLGMSGGVDSTAAALLLLEQGYTVVGVTLRLQDEETERRGNALRDIEDAAAAAERLGIRHIVLDRRARFRECVLDYFAGAYARAETPNPCVACNPRIKFPSLLETADELGARFAATGHYARMIYDEARGRHRLRRADDARKDQSYVLYRLDPAWLPRILFPLGACTKDEARAVVERAGIAISQKADSQDICFVPDGDYGAFLERYTGTASVPGDFVDEQGRVLGRHRGIRHYTVGQRKGLGLSLPEPGYVQSIDPVENRVVISDNNSLYQKTVPICELHWLDGEIPREPLPVTAKIRYAHPPQPALLRFLPDNRAELEFHAPQRAPTPGQPAVFYDGECVLGGGPIHFPTEKRK